MQISKRFASYQHFDRGNRGWSDGVVGVSPALWYFRYIASIFLTLHKRLCMEGLECKNWDEMSATDTIFGRWERAAETMLTLEMKLMNASIQTSVGSR